MKEAQEARLKGKIHDIVSREVLQSPNETIQQYNGRLIDITCEIFNLLTEYNGKN